MSKEVNDEYTQIFSNLDITIYRHEKLGNFKLVPTNSNIADTYTLVNTLLNLDKKLSAIGELHKQWQLVDISEDEYDRSITKELGSYLKQD